MTDRDRQILDVIRSLREGEVVGITGATSSGRVGVAEALWAVLARTLPVPWRVEALVLLALVLVSQFLLQQYLQRQHQF